MRDVNNECSECGFLILQMCKRYTGRYVNNAIRVLLLLCAHSPQYLNKNLSINRVSLHCIGLSHHPNMIVVEFLIYCLKLPVMVERDHITKLFDEVCQDMQFVDIVTDVMKCSSIPLVLNCKSGIYSLGLEVWEPL